MPQQPVPIQAETPLPTRPPGVTVVASTLTSGWAEVLALIVEGTVTSFHSHSSSLHTVAFHLSGTTMVEWKHGGRFTRYLSEPGSLTVIPAGVQHDFRTRRTARALVWMINPDWLHTIAEQEWGQADPAIEIVDVFNSRDAEFWDLGAQLAARIESPIPGTRLYAEALNTQLAIHFLSNYSSLARHDTGRSERPADPRLRRVTDYIRRSLGNEISLAALAALAGLSPNYFLSAFRRATGKTPHRYLTEQRLAKACELLHNPHSSIVDVSLAVGFSSQSHLTSVFRRFLKTTPAAYRQQVLGCQFDGGGSFRENRVAGAAASFALLRSNVLQDSSRST
jgi:AraC family transcriptional regulator